MAGDKLIHIAFPRKLVRDRIPEDIERVKGYCIVKQLEGKEYRKALAIKLVEEALEAGRAKTKQECVSELADLLSVFEAYRIACGIPEQEITMARQLKDAKMGVFAKGYKLMFVFKNFLTRRR